MYIRSTMQNQGGYGDPGYGGQPYGGQPPYGGAPGPYNDPYKGGYQQGYGNYGNQGYGYRQPQYEEGNGCRDCCACLGALCCACCLLDCCLN